VSTLRFVVVGEPQPQGSLKSFRHRSTGAIVSTSDNAALRPWKDRVVLEARQAMKGRQEPLAGPVSVHAAFALRRPKSVRREWPTVRPDLDKLQRAIGDALVEAGVLIDDGQIVAWSPVKRYADHPTSPINHPGVVVAVLALEER
jgi:Holliday junction resolvase RusA-like endonuclease